jgi:hypothetical protein
MVVGMLWLLADYALGFSHVNLFLILPFLLMIVGLFLHVYIQKSESNY